MKAADHRAQAEAKAVRLETATDSPDVDSGGMITVMGKEEALTVRVAAVLREAEMVHSEIQDSEKQADARHVPMREDRQDQEIPDRDSARVQARADVLARADHRVQAEAKAVRIIVITEVKEEETDVSAREEADSVKAQEEAQVLPMQYLLQSLPKAPRTASVSVTEKIKTKRKILIRQAADTDQTRVAAAWYPDCQRHFRSWLPSRNSRKRKNSLK